jgi:hypothetical protein
VRNGLKQKSFRDGSRRLVGSFTTEVTINARITIDSQIVGYPYLGLLSGLPVNQQTMERIFRTSHVVRNQLLDSIFAASRFIGHPQTSSGGAESLHRKSR